MAFLWWNSSIREISDALSGVSELKGVIETKLKQLGFRDVARSDLDVAGNKDGIRVSIGHFHIEGFRYWEIVMAAGDNEATKAANNEVVAMLKNLKFL